MGYNTSVHLPEVGNFVLYIVFENLVYVYPERSLGPFYSPALEDRKASEKYLVIKRIKRRFVVGVFYDRNKNRHCFKLLIDNYCRGVIDISLPVSKYAEKGRSILWLTLGLIGSFKILFEPFHSPV